MNNKVGERRSNAHTHRHTPDTLPPSTLQIVLFMASGRSEADTVPHLMFPDVHTHDVAEEGERERVWKHVRQLSPLVSCPAWKLLGLWYRAEDTLLLLRSLPLTSQSEGEREAEEEVNRRGRVSVWVCGEHQYTHRI